jgi:hypothetical protein
MMNDMMPFSSNTNVPRPMAPPPVWPSYNSAQKNAYSRLPNRYPNASQPTIVNNSSRVKQAKQSVTDGKKVESPANIIEAPRSIVEYKKKMTKSRGAKKELMVPDARPVSLKN